MNNFGDAGLLIIQFLTRFIEIERLVSDAILVFRQRPLSEIIVMYGTKNKNVGNLYAANR